MRFNNKQKIYIRKLPARHVLKSRTFWCTARKAAQAATPTRSTARHFTDGAPNLRCTELHGLATHCGCTALHGLERVYCIAARSCTDQQATNPERFLRDSQRILEDS